MWQVDYEEEAKKLALGNNGAVLERPEAPAIGEHRYEDDYFLKDRNIRKQQNNEKAAPSLIIADQNGDVAGRLDNNKKRKIQPVG